MVFKVHMPGMYSAPLKNLAFFVKLDRPQLCDCQLIVGVVAVVGFFAYLFIYLFLFLGIFF